MAKEQKQPEPPPAPDVPAPDAPAPDAPAAVGPPKSYRLYIALGIVCVILFEVTIMFLLLPAKPVEQQPGLDPTRDTGTFDQAEGASKANTKPETMAECPIGDKNTFNVTNVREDGSEVFKVTINVKVRKADLRRFNPRYEQCQNEVIDRVTVVLNASTTAERADPEHTVIKERVKQAINNVLGQPWVQMVFFAEVTHDTK